MRLRSSCIVICVQFYINSSISMWTGIFNTKHSDTSYQSYHNEAFWSVAKENDKFWALSTETHCYIIHRWAGSQRLCKSNDFCSWLNTTETQYLCLLRRAQWMWRGISRDAAHWGSTLASCIICRAGCPWEPARRLQYPSHGNNTQESTETVWSVYTYPSNCSLYCWTPEKLILETHSLQLARREQCQHTGLVAECWDVDRMNELTLGVRTCTAKF